MPKPRAITLIELLLVISLIAILSGIAIPNYIKAKEHALGQEASANLLLIAAAERAYRMEQGGSYYPTTASTVSILSTINDNLNLALSSTNWSYSITTTGSNPSTAFTATADRVSTDCLYEMKDTYTKPLVKSGTCP